MDRLCSTIVVLLLTEGALYCALQEEQMDVHLEPKNVNVCEGASVTMNCTFQPNKNYKVSWYYSKTPVSGCTSEKIPEEQRFIKDKSDAWSTLNITFINATESGWYFCKVTQDIPVLKENCSNGTQVIVDAPSTSTSTSTSTRTSGSQDPTQNQTTGNLSTTCSNNVTIIPITSQNSLSSFPPWWLWLAAAAGCVVFLVSVAVIWILTRKPEEIIYENTTPVESSCWRRNRTKTDICDLPASKKTDTIKPLRKYDTLSSNRIRRP